MPSELSNKAILLLSPIIGNSMALSIIAETCKSINTDIEKLDESKLKTFAEQLEKTLIPRFGPATATKAREKFMEMAAKKEIQEVEGINEVKIDEGIDNEIMAFLEKNVLPADSDITDYARYLSKKYGGDARSVEKTLTDKVKVHVRNAISRRKMKEEIDAFLTNFSQPKETDMIDFINYFKLLKLDFNEEELREQIETQRLIRKFERSHEDVVPEIDKFMEFVKGSKDKGAVGDAMKRNGLTYLIKDDSGDTDKSLSELMDIITPNDKDMKEALQNMGLGHLVKK